MRLLAVVPILFLADILAQNLTDPDPNTANCVDICSEIVYLEATINGYGCDCSNPSSPCNSLCQSLDTWRSAADVRCKNGCILNPNSANCNDVCTAIAFQEAYIDVNVCQCSFSSTTIACQNFCKSLE